MTNLGRGFKALTFVLGAVNFGVAQFIGPPTALLYATLTTYCYTEDISLKRVFKKAFNPVLIASRKVGDAIRNNKWQVVSAIGIGVVGAMIGAPIAGILAPFFGPMLGVIAASGITISVMATSMVSGFIRFGRMGDNRKIDDLYYSIAQMTYQLYKILDREVSRFDKKFDFSKDLQYLKEKFDEYYAIWTKHHRGKYWTQEGTVEIKIVAARASHTYKWFLDRFLKAYEDAHGTRDDETTKFFKDYKYFMQFVKKQTYRNLRAPIKTRVALFESLVDIFPKFWGVPFSNNRLAKMIFTKDTAGAFLSKGRINSRIDFSTLLEIDYNTYKLTEAHFKALGIKISSDQLEELKSKVSQFIKEFIFSNPFDIPYINEMDKENSEVYTESKYDLYRGLYFLESKNKGRAITLKELGDAVKTSVLSAGQFLAEGIMLDKRRDPYNRIRSYILSQSKTFLRGITYKAFELHALSLKSHLSELVGTYTHRPIELLMLLSLKSHGFTRGIISEQEVGSLGKKVDLFIPATAQLLKVIGDLQKTIPKGIKNIVIDLTHEAKNPKLRLSNIKSSIGLCVYVPTSSDK
ncbi:hypothetical protein ES707_18368 [subsurface metagenome]